MHVTLVSGINPEAPHAGGTRAYVLGLAERLRRRDIDVSLIARDGLSASVPGVQYTRIRSGPSSARFLLGLTAQASRLGIPSDSIIHAQRPDDLVPFAFAKRQNPKVCTLHGVASVSIWRRHGRGYGFAYRMLERFGLGHADHVIAVDRGTASWYASRYPWVGRRTSVVPVAVDTDHFRPLDREEARREFRITHHHALVYAGRLSVEKRVDSIIRILPQLEDTELLIAGDGPTLADLRALARNRPVRFLGPVPHDGMPRLLNAADALVLPSEFEGLPTVVLEALACGSPVVATPVGAIPEIIFPGRNGWLVRPGLEDFGEGLRKAISAPGTMTRACVEAARPFSWDVVAERIVGVYRAAGGGA